MEGAMIDRGERQLRPIVAYGFFEDYRRQAASPHRREAMKRTMIALAAFVGLASVALAQETKEPTDTEVLAKEGILKKDLPRFVRKTPHHLVAGRDSDRLHAMGACRHRCPNDKGSRARHTRS
jgi:hypothetical protein